MPLVYTVTMQDIFVDMKPSLVWQKAAVTESLLRIKRITFENRLALGAYLPLHEGQLQYE